MWEQWNEWTSFVKKYESFSATPYRCPAGVWTIGYGHTGPDVTAHSLRINESKGDALLAQDMGEALAQAFELSPGMRVQSPRRLMAIADFCFNAGPGNYAKSTLRKRVNEGQWNLAALENAKWVYGGGKKLTGLIRRRATTSQWLKEG